MSAARQAPDSFAWLPEPLRPRDRERSGSGRLWLIETTLLVLVGVLLATATLNDVARQTGVNDRLIADLATWRAYTGHRYHNLEVDTELLGEGTTHEVVCGNTSPGAPKARIQLCLAIWGPIRDGRRGVHGGWYIPPGSEDQRSERYGCFGEGAEGICSR
ncbi:MAG TPA: hypothetical protein VHT27_00265 [Solirubrobacteraceae bacterium]|jgi:hypothetical protein|nr:hypothetical protein [Solirubrobacteraceae bacterium]